MTGPNQFCWFCFSAAAILLGMSLSTAGWLLGNTAPDNPPYEPLTAATAPTNQADCGAVSLYVICKLAGKETPLPSLRELTGTSLAGTNLLNVNEAADALGFNATACECSFAILSEHLKQQRSYAILYSPKSHFISAIGAAGCKIHVVDGIRPGDMWLNQADLFNLYDWAGKSLLLTID